MTDMTIGTPWRHLIKYALPLLAANALQLLYNAADTVIAGRFIGPEALAAEGTAGPVMNLVILAVSGMCIGSGVLMSEAYGRKQFAEVRSILGSTITLGLLSALLVAIPGFFLSPLIIRLLGVPSDISAMASSYLAITFLGTPFTFFYNTLAAGLKSVGDTKTPLRFLSFSAILNIVLDCIFIGLLGFGIICSAVTTVVAEAVSAVLALYWTVRHERDIVPTRSDFTLKKERLSRIMAYGAPSALQQAIQPICKVLIQSQVNALGVVSIAAYNAVTKADDFACIPAQGIGSAISTFTAQNRGAGKKDRIKTGFRSGITIAMIYGVIIFSLTYLFRVPLMSLFVTEGNYDVVITGASYLALMAFFYFLPAATNALQGFFRGMGRMKMVAVNTFLQASLRTVFTYLLAPEYGIRGIAVSCAIGWSVMILAMAFEKIRINNTEF